MKRIAILLALVASLSLPTVAAAGSSARVVSGARGVALADQWTCDPFIPDAVTFVITPWDFPDWSDGLVTVHVSRLSGRILSLRADRVLAGLIIIGDHIERGYRLQRSSVTVALPRDTLRAVLVCFYGS